MNLFVLFGCVAIGSGCGLIDSDIADFDLSLPAQEIVVDSSQWGLMNVSQMRDIDCSTNANTCSSELSSFCDTADICEGSCNEGSCDLTISVNFWQTLDLSKEKPGLQKIEGQPLVSVAVNRVIYKIQENTLNVGSPVMGVYVAPNHVMDSSHQSAEFIGSIPKIPAGMVTGEMEVELTLHGKEILSEYMKKYSVPFNLVIGAELIVEAGADIPTGRMKAVVLASAVAGL